MSYLHTLLKLSEGQSISQKINSIQGAIEYLEQIHDKTLGDVSSQTWSSIVAVFSVMGCAACLPSLPPILGFGLVGGAVASTIASVATAAQAYPETKMKDEKVALILGVLRSNTPKQWAHVWEESPDTNAFLMGIERASNNGYIDSVGYFRYYGANNRHPFDVAREWAIAAADASLAASEDLPKLSPSPEVSPPVVGQTTKLMAIDVPVVEPADEAVEAPIVPNQSSQSPLPPDKWAPDLMGYPSILIYGAQGAGKTSTAAWLIRERIKAGHQIKVLDPHRGYGQWNGLECIGDGMDYDAINDELKAFTDEIKARYKTRSKVANYSPTKLTLVCDEFTQWAKKCGHSATFFEESLTDIRKVNLHVLFISHARTLSGLGGSTGLADTRDAGLLELELEAQVDPQTKKASPKLQGWLKYPGISQNQRNRVAIANWMNGSMDFLDVTQFSSSADGIVSRTPNKEVLDVQKLEELFNAPAAKEVEGESHVDLLGEGKIKLAVEAVEEYLFDKELDSQFVRIIYGAKNRLRVTFKTQAEFVKVIEQASQEGKLSYFVDGKSYRVGFPDIT